MRPRPFRSILPTLESKPRRHWRMKPEEPKSELILYRAENNRTRIEVRLVNKTVWRTQNQMADLFQTTDKPKAGEDLWPKK